MNGTIIPFAYDDDLLRVLRCDGEPWWVHADVCIILDISQPHRAADRLDDDEKGRHTVTTLGGPQEMTIINESGLWSLVLTSRKPEAKRFNGVVKRHPTARRFKGVTKRYPLSTHQSILNGGLCA